MGTNYSGSYAAPRLDLGVAFMEHMADLKEFIGMQILPIFRSMKRSASFSAITRESLLQDRAANRAARSGYNRINTQGEDKSFECLEYGLEHVIDDSERALYESDFDADLVGSKTLARALMLQFEKRVATLIFNTTTWTGSTLYTDVSAAPWDTAASDVIAHVAAAKQKVADLTGMMPNALILARKQYHNLLANTGILARLTSAIVTTEDAVKTNLAAILGLEKIIVGGSVRNSALEGQTYSGADVWTDDYAMVALVADEGASLATPCVGRTILWTPDSPTDLVMEQYREEQVRGDVLRARHYLDELVLDVSFGHLLKID